MDNRLAAERLTGKPIRLQDLVPRSTAPTSGDTPT